MTYFEDVAHWNAMMGQPVEDRLSDTLDFDSPSLRLGISLVREEFTETMDAWAGKDINGIADGVVDLIWVLCGLLARMGIDLDSVWDEVRKANYAKLGGPVRADGKVLKPEGWKPPDISAALVRGRGLFTLIRAFRK